MDRIVRISTKFAAVFKLLLVVYPMFVVAAWFGKIPFPKIFFTFSVLPFDVDLATVKPIIKWSAFAVELIPVTITMLSIYFLTKLFNLFSKKIIFTYENIKLIRNIALTLFLEVIVEILIEPVLSLIFTMYAPKGGHLVTISFGNQQMSGLIIAGIVMLIAWIMEEGRKLEEVTAFTV